MEFRILGPLEVWEGGAALALGGAKQRALLATLILNRNEPVSQDRLAQALWGEEASSNAVRTVHVYIARLRRALGDPARLERTGGGYRLGVRRDELDADLFEERLARGQQSFGENRLDDCGRYVRQALGLWRGPALADFRYAPFAQSEIRRLEAQRGLAHELLFDAEIAMGRHTEVIGELQRLVAQEPTRERLVAQLMLALYRCGRQRDALAAYRVTRRALVDELGIEPGPELRDLERRMLAQDAALTGSAAVAAPAARDPSPPLPPRVEPLFGRAADAAALLRLIEAGSETCITVTGPAGVGKTAIAIEVAHRMRRAGSREVVWIELADMTDVEQLPARLLHALGAQPDGRGAEWDTVRAVLANGSWLVVMDNAEHLLPQLAPAVSALQGTAAVTLLTSRAPLEVRDELRFPLAPLGCAPTATAGGEPPAFALYVARARRRDPRFDPDADPQSIQTLCERLGGLPLAIELAAARVEVLAPADVLHRFDDVLGALGRGPRDAPDRQRSLRATLDWSYALLQPGERELLAALSVFAGGCTLDAAEAVTGARLDDVQTVMGHGLVQPMARSGSSRLTMLEPVRQYAAECLTASGRRHLIEAAHVAHFAAFADAAARELEGPHQMRRARQIDQEAANLRRAMHYAFRSGDADSLLRIAAGIQEWWNDRGLWTEGRAWLERGLAHLPGEAHPRRRAEALYALAYLNWPVDGELIVAYASEALAIYRELGDLPGEVRALSAIACGQSQVRHHAEAQRAAEAACRLAAGRDDALRAVAQYALTAARPDLPETADAARELAQLLERTGDLRMERRMWDNLAFEAILAGDAVRGQRYVTRALDVMAQLQSPVETWAFASRAGVIALMSDRLDEAAAIFRDVLARCRAFAFSDPVVEALLGLANVAVRQDDRDHASELCRAAATLAHGRRLTRIEEVLIKMFPVDLGPDLPDASAPSRRTESAHPEFRAAIALALGGRRLTRSTAA